jgi:nucleoid-associated protein YgaU
MSLQEKYQGILDLANENGTTYELSGDESVLHIDGTAPSDDAKAALWAKYEELDPNFASSDLILNITTAEAAAAGNTYTVESGDSLSKIGAKYGIAWKAIWDANRDILHEPDKIYPGQELKIP